MNERLNNHLQMLHRVRERFNNAQNQSDGLISDEILHQLTQVIDQLREHSADGYDFGRDWLINILVHQPQLTPAIERDLLWFFGGDCLHFLTDDEINLFQRLDELEEEHDNAQEAFDRQATKALILAGQSNFNA